MSDLFDEAFIDRIYDAALKPELWNDLLITTADMMHSAVGLACGMSVDGEGTLFCHYGRHGPPQDKQLGGRHMLNPWTTAVHQEPVGRILPSHEILPLRDLQRTEFYADILAPEKVDHCVITNVSRVQNVNFTLSIMRGDKQGAYTAEEIKKLHVLLPHLRRSAQMRLNLEAYHVLSLQQQRILDKIHTGVILVDDMGRYHCVNRAAEELVGEDNGLTLINNSLTARDAKTSRKLLELVASTAAGGAGGSLAIPRDMLDPLLVLVCPIRGTIRDALRVPGQDPQTVALFMKDPLRGYADLDDVLEPLFRLTRAEVRVALALGRGESVNATATYLGISQNTLKTHAKRIYEKMSVSNHAELVRKLSRLASF